MPTNQDKTWDERRQDLLSDACELAFDVEQRKIPHVSDNMQHIWVHFFDEDDNDIGHLGLGKTLHALNNDIHTWAEASTECDDNGEPVADLDIRDAVRIEARTH